MISHAEMLLRIGAGAALGGIIGYERDRHRRHVGFRTHLIVALASATFMVISSQFAFFQHYEKGGVIEIDASRIAASVVSGIGFLAGGAILRTGLTVQGLTTAAGLWLVTAIGMSAGAGMFVESAAVTAMGIVALTVLRRFEDKDVIRRRVEVTIDEEGTQALGTITERLAAIGVSVYDVAYARRLDEGGRHADLTLDVTMPESLGVERLVQAIESLPDVRRIQIQLRA